MRKSNINLHAFNGYFCFVHRFKVEYCLVVDKAIFLVDD